ncbi:MAG: S41 family peptidase, partial [Planctomycetota bacterium]
ASGVTGRARRITEDAKVLRYNGQASPDGTQLAYTDRDQFLWLLDVKTGTSRKVTQSADGSAFDRPDLAWSADGRWLVYSDAGANSVQRVFLFGTRDAKAQPVPITTDRLDSYSAEFSADGKWLYFLSDRTFRSVQRSPWGARAPEAYLDKTTSIFALDLTGGQRFPFQPSDELTAASQKAAGSESNADRTRKPGDAKDGDAAVVAQYKLEDFTGRLYRVPVAAGNYRDLRVASSHLYFIESPIGLDRKRHLLSVPIGADPEKHQATRIASEIDGFRLSADRSKILLRKEDGLYVFAANGKKPDLRKSRVDLSALKIGVRPADEWRQMFVDAWRLHRDYFYDPAMHKVDWKAVRERHEALLDRVSDRYELDDLISLMVGELSAMHTNIRVGDVRDDKEEASLGYLGARFKRAEGHGGYRVEHIYQNDPDYPNDLSPLQRPGIDVRVGDIITAIDGVPTLSVPDARQLLLNKAGRQVLLETRRDGDPDLRQSIVRPLHHNAFRSLKLSEWEYTRRLETEKRSDGTIGYFHMRAMGTSNYAEFVKGFYPVFDRQGLVIDMRQNYGGNIDSWILGRLMRKAWMYWKARTGTPYSNMHFAFRGHMVVLVDAYTISDGEAFSEGFRRLGLGPLIGTKTWGGGIWLRSSNRLVDGGLARSPEFGVFSPDRNWIIEGSGVEPTIRVDNLPHQSFRGRDAQLEAAIEYLKKKIAEDPRKIPEAPAYPDKAKQELPR